MPKLKPAISPLVSLVMAYSYSGGYGRPALGMGYETPAPPFIRELIADSVIPFITFGLGFSLSPKHILSVPRIHLAISPELVPFLNILL